MRFFLASIVFFVHLDFYTTGNTLVYFIKMFGGKAAVIGFLLVSGYSIAASLERDRQEFYRRRIYRVYPLYFVSIVFAFTLEIITGNRVDLPHLTLHGLGWPVALSNLAFLQTFIVKPIQYNGPVWSLSIEILYYYLAPIFVKMNVKWLYLLIVFSMICYLLPKYSNLGICYQIASKFNALNYLWCWLSGFLLYKYKNISNLFLLLVGIPIIFYNKNTYELLSTITYIITLITLIFCDQIYIKIKIRKYLKYLRDLSYPLYLLHYPSLIFVYVILGFHIPIVLMIIPVLISICALHVIEYYIKRVYIRPVLWKLH